MRTWPHAPCKRVSEPGIYIVTAATYEKEAYYSGEGRLQVLQNTLLSSAEATGWEMMAWAVFPNHYHFVALAPTSPKAVQQLTRRVHAITARIINAEDEAPGRQVWYRSWDTHLTFEKSVLTRLAYVHNNAAKHGFVEKPEDYKFCSARWFLDKGDPSFVQTVLGFKIDQLNILDDF